LAYISALIVWICLHSYFFVVGSKRRIFATIEFVSVVQGHPPRWFWYQWKAHIRLPVSPS